jgi:2-oxoglutarate/2-oxoacid ferredoxin oxidoreductase subunit alpha
MPRISVKIVGASGQGINSIGAIVAKGLKRSEYCVFGYREYPDLIKGGHAWAA